MNLKLLNFYFENFWYWKFKPRFLKTSNLPSRKDVMRRICSVELKFSGFVLLSKFCVLSRGGELLNAVNFVEVCWISCIRFILQYGSRVQIYIYFFLSGPGNESCNLIGS